MTTDIWENFKQSNARNAWFFGYKICVPDYLVTLVGAELVVQPKPFSWIKPLSLWDRTYQQICASYRWKHIWQLFSTNLINKNYISFCVWLSRCTFSKKNHDRYTKQMQIHRKNTPLYYTSAPLQKKIYRMLSK